MFTEKRLKHPCALWDFKNITDVSKNLSKISQSINVTIENLRYKHVDSHQITVLNLRYTNMWYSKLENYTVISLSSELRLLLNSMYES
jgi:hypothetical protein